MLSPNKNRLDYGEQLIPPKGFALSRAIATSFSLDLNTLLTVPIAMCFGQTLEGDVEDMRVALFEALTQLEDKLTVFYQQGNIKLPVKFNSLFGLLEPCLQPVVPDAGSGNSVFSSFHPKIWLLRFESLDDPETTKYRLIVLSRNLTFDRSWDLAAVLEGDTKKRRHRANLSLIHFFEELYANSGNISFNEVIAPEELARVHWRLPDNIRSAEFLSTLFDDNGSRQPPISLNAENQALMVVSPFIRSGQTASALEWLKTFAPDQKRFLFSRAEELNLLGKEKLKGWTCYAFNELLVDAEELEEMEVSSFAEHDLSLHGKLIVADETDCVSSWHLGSANATQAALGDGSAAPRNTEFMLKLVGDKEKIGIEMLKQQWTNESNTGLFVEFEPSDDMEMVDNEATEKALRKLEYDIIQADWHLTVNEGMSDNVFDLQLAGPRIDIPNNHSVQVTTLSVVQFRALAVDIQWHHLKASQISALLHFEISMNGNVMKNLVVQSELVLNCEIERKRAITSEIMANSAQFMRYIAFLLQVEPTKQDLFNSTVHHTGQGDTPAIFDKNSVLFEKLMRATATEPELLIRIHKLQSRVEQSIIPDEFKALWQVFSRFVPQK